MVDTAKRLVAIGDEHGWWDETDPDLGVWHCNHCQRTLVFSPASAPEAIQSALRAHIERYCEGAR
jgi:hypothetical protein